MKQILLILALSLTACTAQKPASDGPQAQCLVCKRNADLACVDITVTDSTPRYDYQGQRYYFCSEECRNEFMQHPNKYLP